MFGFITKWLESYKKKSEERNLRCESLLVRIDYVLSEEEVLFADAIILRSLVMCGNALFQRISMILQRAKSTL